MANATLLCSPLPIFKQTHSLPTLRCPEFLKKPRPLTGNLSIPSLNWKPKPMIGIVGSALALALAGSASASELPLLLGTSLPLSEPANALSLPTWAIHVSSVVEWITAMALVWQYGEKSGFESWKGLSWGMVLVALQAALTVIGNATMCYAAFRICKVTDKNSQKL
ncbi:uncharacterized protein [Gossypium hirsutum]|uniref:Uncharacterized protein isoform X2 n=1 Tax=Gossypium hirsutum TaxID=3635 RepID=A0ABM3B8H6_GOSHI|nr:uncharacterized protein LOC107946975 isoform X2 [Gossypium hirsutum]